LHSWQNCFSELPPRSPGLVKSLTLGHHQFLKVEDANALYADGEESAREYFSNSLMGPAVADMLGDLPDDSDFLNETRRQAQRFLKAAGQQHDMDAIGADVAMLATALIKFPNLQAVRLDNSLHGLLSKSHWGAKALFADTGVRRHVPEPQWPAPDFYTSTTLLTNTILKAQRV